MGNAKEHELRNQAKLLALEKDTAIIEPLRLNGLYCVALRLGEIPDFGVFSNSVDQLLWVYPADKVCRSIEVLRNNYNLIYDLNKEWYEELYLEKKRIGG